MVKKWFTASKKKSRQYLDESVATATRIEIKSSKPRHARNEFHDVDPGNSSVASTATGTTMTPTRPRRRREKSVSDLTWDRAPSSSQLITAAGDTATTTTRSRRKKTPSGLSWDGSLDSKGAYSVQEDCIIPSSIPDSIPNNITTTSIDNDDE